MAERSRAASTLNKLTDRAFVTALSPRDQASMCGLIADFFCGHLDTDVSDFEEEEELGKFQLWYRKYFIPTTHTQH